MRRKWLKSTAELQRRQRSSRAAADPVPPCRSLHFNWSPLQKRNYLTGYTLISKLYVPVIVHRVQSVKKEYQQDATI